VAALLGGVGLSGRGGEMARSLPYGDQKRVELARALAA
jgi:branched-chain amino acid transport system ATP-binding protein